MRIELRGLEELRKKLNPNVLLGKPLREAMLKSVLFLEAEVKSRTPVDTGRLRGSITHSIAPDPIPLWAKVGTNVEYAPFVEEGTRPHWPPIEAIKPWARRHRLSPWAVAVAIARRGTKGAHMFRRAFEAAEGQIRRFLDGVARDIETRFGK